MEIIAIFLLKTNNNLSGCSAVRLAHLLWEQGVPGSNPGTPTLKKRKLSKISFFFLFLILLLDFERDIYLYPQKHYEKATNYFSQKDINHYYKYLLQKNYEKFSETLLFNNPLKQYYREIYIFVTILYFY